MDVTLFEETLRGLASSVALVIDDSARAVLVLRQVRDRAPDERLALAFLLQLAEISKPALNKALSDEERAADLIFCLGGSELVGSGLAAAGPAWVEILDRARSGEPSSGPPPSDVSSSTRRLGEYKKHEMLRIAIGDLLGRGSVTETVTAMSR